MIEAKEPIMVEQLNHKPTYDYLELVYKYAKESKYKKALDIGAGIGLTTLAILEAGNGKVDMVSPVVTLALLSKYNHSKRVKLYKGFSQDILPELKGKYQFILIDGDHSYEAVKSDINMSLKLLDDNGIIFCDDYERYPNDVKKAVDEFSELNITIIGGKAVIKK